MTHKEELKELIAQMDEKQFEWFTSQMLLLLSEEAAESVPQIDCQ